MLYYDRHDRDLPRIKSANPYRTKPSHSLSYFYSILF